MNEIEPLTIRLYDSPPSGRGTKGLGQFRGFQLVKRDEKSANVLVNLGGQLGIYPPDDLIANPIKIVINVMIRESHHLKTD
jgi:hypothetical protein